MSEIKTKTIKRVDLKPEPWGNHGFYGHKIFFTDGTKGEAYKCTDPNPQWMKEGKTIQFQEEQGSFSNCPFIIPLESIDQLNEVADNRAAANGIKPQTPAQKPWQKKTSGWGNRFEDSPPAWLAKQKFIAILKLYEIYGGLVESSQMKYEDLQNEVLKSLDFIIEKSGVNKLGISTASIPTSVSVPASAARPSIGNRHIPVAKSSPTAIVQKSAVREREELHQSAEAQEIPDVNPEVYSDRTPNPELFGDGLSDEKAPKEIIAQINGCTKYSELKKIHKGLSDKNLKNSNIAHAYFEMKRKLSKNK